MEKWEGVHFRLSKGTYKSLERRENLHQKKINKAGWLEDSVKDVLGEIREQQVM